MQSGRNISRKKLTYYNNFVNCKSCNNQDVLSISNISSRHDINNNEVCNDRDCHCYKKKIVNLVITLETKVGHPWVTHIKNNLCFAIDGIKGKTLYLERGFTYNFFFRFDNIRNIERKHSFIFTNDPLGGSRTNIIRIPISSTDTYPIGFGQTVSLYIDNTLPNVFFYQSLCDTCMGGIIIINDPITCDMQDCSKKGINEENPPINIANLV